ncbi:hypothetical protein BH10ACI3_BH10ACI3_29730 [soil metagenome]
MKNEITHFALCLNNKGYPASLEVGKLYRIIADEQAAAESLIRIVDESGDGYAFASNRFHIVELPVNVEETLVANGSGILSMA